MRIRWNAPAIIERPGETNRERRCERVNFRTGNGRGGDGIHANKRWGPLLNQTGGADWGLKRRGMLKVRYLDRLNVRLGAVVRGHLCAG